MGRSGAGAAVAIRCALPAGVILLRALAPDHSITTAISFTEPGGWVNVATPMLQRTA